MMAASTPDPMDEEFELETRFVVLSFLGLIPSNALDQSYGSKTTSSSASAHSRSTSGHSGDYDSGHHLTSLPQVSLEQKVDRLRHRGDVDGEFETLTFDNSTDEPEDTVDTVSPSKNRERLRDTINMHLQGKLEDHDLEHNSPTIKHDRPTIRKKFSRGQSFNKNVSRPSSIPVKAHYPSSTDAHGYDEASRLIERQLSASSSRSGVTIPVSLVSSHSTYVDVGQVEQLEALVEGHVLPPEVIPLKRQLSLERHELEEQTATHKGKASSGVLLPSTPLSGPAFSTQGSTALSPEAEVAQYLSILGDQVQERYSTMLNSAFEALMGEPELTYTSLQKATQELDRSTRGWTKVAVLLMFSKKVTYEVLKKAPGSLADLTRHTTRLISDSAAKFIVDKGGWHAIHELGSLSPGVSEGDEDDDLPLPPDADVPAAGGGGDGQQPDPCEPDAPSTATLTQSGGEDTPDCGEEEELPHDAVDAPPQGDGPVVEQASSLSGAAASVAAASPASSSSSVEEEASENVERIRPLIPLWRQTSREYGESARREAERWLAQRRSVVVLTVLCVGVAVGVAVWRKYRG